MPTTRDFELTAKVIREWYQEYRPPIDGEFHGDLEKCMVDALVSRFSQAFSATSPRFRPFTFARACYGLNKNE